MTHCTTGPNGGRCRVCVVWDEAMHWVRLLEQEREIEVGMLKAQAEYHKSVAQMRKDDIVELRAKIALLADERDALAGEVMRGR